MKTYSITASQVIPLGAANAGAVGRWLLQFSGTMTDVACTIRKKLEGSAVADASAGVSDYRNELTQEDVAGSTPITATGVYSVYSDGCSVIADITYTSGSGVLLEVEAVRG